MATAAQLTVMVEALTSRMDAAETENTLLKARLKALVDRADEVRDKLVGIVRDHRSTDDKAEWLVHRTDELGEDVVRTRRAAKMRQQQVPDEATLAADMGQRLASRVKAVRVGNRTVMRAVNPR